MTKREIGKYNSYAQIASAFEARASVFSDHVQFKKGVADFTLSLDRLDDLAVRQSAKTDGSSAAKAQALHVLGNLAHRVASGIAACAHDAANGELAGRVAYSRTNITRGPDAAVISRCKNIHTAGTEYAGEIVEYGVSAADLTNLKKKIDAFQALQPAPRRAKAATSSATKELKRLLKEVDELLSLKLDKLIVQFKDSEPDFYNEYISARRIVVSGVRSKPENVVAVPGTTRAAEAA
jgi:hypothetical protein